MPEHHRRTTSPRRVLVALCTAAVTAIGGLTSAQVGYADPELTLEQVQERVDELHHTAEQATERYNAATDELADIERRLARSQKNVETQQAKVKNLTADMGGFAAAAYRNGSIDPTMQALLAEDPEEFLAQASVIDAYASQQADQLSAVAAERQQLEQISLLADEELGRFKAVETVLEEEAAEVERLLADAEELLDGLEAEERAQLEAERAAAAERESRAAEREAEDSEPAPDVPASERAQVAVDFAMAQLGDPYQWGGNGPNSWDCSGLTKAAWAQAGVSLPRSSYQQIGVGTRVSRDQLAPGDLVFFYSPISHVGIYIGDGMMVHATKPGDVVSVDPINQMPFSGATRPG